MPAYQYECPDCGHAEEHFQRMSDPQLTKCPKCKKKNYARVFTEPNAIVRGNPKTFGQAAEENAKRVGKEQLEIMAEEDKARVRGFTGKLPDGARSIRNEAATPPWRKGKPNLKILKNPDKYIKTGKV